MEIKTKVGIDNITEDRQASIWRRRSVEIDGEQLWVGEQDRVSVVPGDFAVVEEFAPTLLEVVTALWTEPFIEQFAETLRSRGKRERNIIDSSELLEAVKQIILEEAPLHPHLQKMGITGSLVTDTFTAESDIDIVYKASPDVENTHDALKEAIETRISNLGEYTVHIFAVTTFKAKTLQVYSQN
jgi:predicted nucleotidyltransferase